mgnify:CR=1 FL=1
MERADKAKATLAKKEAKDAFNIKVLPMRFGQDNRKFTAYPEQNALSPAPVRITTPISAR